MMQEKQTLGCFPQLGSQQGKMTESPKSGHLLRLCPQLRFKLVELPKLNQQADRSALLPYDASYGDGDL